MPDYDIENTNYTELLNYVQRGEWECARAILEAHPEAVNASLSFDGGTVLHTAVLFGHLHIVKELVQLVSEQYLELNNDFGRTALHLACRIGFIEMAECMVRKNENLLRIPTRDNYLPVSLSLANGNKEMALYLYQITKFEELLPEKGHHGATLLVQCFNNSALDMAKDLLQRCPRLAITPAKRKRNILVALSGKPSAFLSGCHLRFWEKWIYNWIHLESASLTVDIRNRAQHSNTTKRNAYNMSMIPGIGKIYQEKVAHELSLEILRITSKEIATISSNREQMIHSWVYISLFQAARLGNSEFIIEVTRVCPNLLFQLQDKSSGKSIFFNAVESRQAKVFSLIYGPWTNLHASHIDGNGNGILHMAGMLAPPAQLNRISGAALQMQRELQWFKEVEHIMIPARTEWTNNDNMTARQLFTQNHKDLVKEGEKWMKGAATSCTVVGALIVTIMFAAAFTVPGGNNQNTGYPMFLKQKLFKLYIISDAVSLFSSATSVLMFLGILTSRYAEDDFLKSLPTKLIIGLSLLFISIEAMMITFCAALSIMFPGGLWIIIPVISFASVPVSLFVWLQFPLLVDICVSTYGPGIFDRTPKRWF